MHMLEDTLVEVPLVELHTKSLSSMLQSGLQEQSDVLVLSVVGRSFLQDQVSCVVLHLLLLFREELGLQVQICLQVTGACHPQQRWRKCSFSRHHC